LNIALPCRSVLGDRPYTTPGLGDRIHSLTCAWAYGQAHGEPVTLHVTREQMIGGQFNNKPQSWAEIVALFPEGSVAIQPHDFSPASQKEWTAHVGADSFWYGDYPGPKERAERIDIAAYLKRIPLLARRDATDRFVTVQWDAGGASRRVSAESQRNVLAQFPGAVTVGGGYSIENAACLMSMAEAHVGVDSAFFHLAQLYFPPNRIYVCYRPGAMSHHVKRAIDNGIHGIECP
jgi:hypothetical protein